MANEFTGRRTVKADITFVDAASTFTTGIKIPAGALIQGIYWEGLGAATVTGASATVQPKLSGASTKNLCAAAVMSALPAQTVAASTAASSIRVTETGELVVFQQASSNAAATKRVALYVDYIYI